jgi:hypothetical protein
VYDEIARDAEMRDGEGAKSHAKAAAQIIVQENLAPAGCP